MYEQPKEGSVKSKLASVALAAAILAGGVAAAPAASAAPVMDQEVTRGDCAIGHAHTTYNQRLGREQTICLKERYDRPLRPVIRKSADRWWNPFSWWN